ncbi:MAG TPA: tetratricopeptide repeat protein [Candidatus Sumerlaeota bacterium]|nr:MAG: lipoprotein NlpI [candidate division BRC1 bacterium ADurb.Bin183]HON50605.1 tetratricopeptide repeat protein [Candidatus Sumerlaeota bacterium]HPL74865.1 tetratricopeptide repeat protein [Candidatus Sumerlaeota bacterium]HRR29834.1 tetratricopeptide repeat protein [Candidatus Sumerlaeia bacterium]HRU53169.1 tetratricopeptide repeat protein [Candidatus Sumerlaeia bacterium]
MKNPRANLIPFLIILVVSAGCYLNALGGGFAFDDVDMVQNNFLIRSLKNMPEIWRTSWWSGSGRRSNEYRPLAVFSFALNYTAGKLNPLGYHLVNILLHALFSILFYWFLKKIGSDEKMALISALLFAAHPIHTEPVNNIVGRAEILAAIFVFAGLIQFWNAHKTNLPAKRLVCLLASAMFFLLGMLSKESAIALLPAVLFLALMNRMPPTNTVRAFLFYGITLVLYLIMRRHALGGFVTSGMKVSPIDNVLVLAEQRGGWIPYYATVIKAFGIYVRLLLFPLTLSADYSYNQVPLATGFFEAGAVISIILLAAHVWLIYYFWKNKQWIPLWGVLFFLFALAPVSNAFKMIGTLIGERLLYLPSAGFCIVVGWAFSRADLYFRRRGIALILCALLVLAYGVRCLLRNPEWKDDNALYAATLRTSPNVARIHNNIGTVLKEEKNYSKALIHFERAAEIAPFYGAPIANKGEVLRLMGRPEESIPLQEKVIAMQPDYSPAHFFHAEALRDAGEKNADAALYKKSAESYKSAIALCPLMPLFHLRLGMLYLDHHSQPELSEEHLKKARELNARLLPALTALGQLEMRRKNYQKANEYFIQAKKEFPEDPAPYYYLGMMALELKNPEETEKYFKDVLALAPNDPFSYLNLGRLYSDNMDRPADARKYYRQFLEKFPDHPLRAEAEDYLKK